jgi:hypothetical protein
LDEKKKEGFEWRSSRARDDVRDVQMKGGRGMKQATSRNLTKFSKVFCYLLINFIYEKLNKSKWHGF